MAASLELYVKIWCPWCVMAQDWLDAHGYHYDLIDVEKNRAAYEVMQRVSGQRLTPTLVVDGVLVLPDFGPEELATFLQKHTITPS